MALSFLPAGAAGLSGIASIIDGDTLEINGERVRLFGIDAPESRQHCISAGKQVRCGQAAARALDAFIGNRPISCVAKDRDGYGRMVAVCRVAEADLNEWLVRRGHAVAYTRYSKAYVAAEAEARRARRGIWAGVFETPEDWRRARRSPKTPQAVPPGECRIKGNVGKSGRIYHFPGQRDYDRTRIDERRGERWFCSEGEARRAGWRPSGVRKPD
ncbi:MAG: thermonuclease family protein [Sphingomonadales bacterium]